MAEAVLPTGRARPLVLDGRPASPARVIGDVWRHRQVLMTLAKADFQVRYKRASLGVIWAVVVPLLQALMMAVVFSKVVKVGRGQHFAVYVMTGVLAWSYFSLTIGSASVAIVSGSGLTDKVWFPRALLPIVPAIANLVALGVSMVALVIFAPLLGAELHLRILLLLPACALLVVFATSLSLVLAALHVYFRDVRYLVISALVVWLYATPIIYRPSLLGNLEKYVYFNPMTGVIALFHAATIGPDPHWMKSVTVTLIATVLLVVAAIEIYRRHDRLFVDLL